jgi:hypothetical protein
MSRSRQANGAKPPRFNGAVLIGGPHLRENRASKNDA